MTPELSAWLVAFVFTQAIEVPIYLAALRIDRPTPSSSRLSPLWAQVAVAFGASALTHPIVWFVIPTLFAPERYWTMVACAETFAVLAEALYLRLFGLRRAFAWSLLANAASCGLGFACRAAFDFP